MKSTKHRLLSLFLALVLVCSLVPSAFASTQTQNGTVEIKGNSTVTKGSTITLSAGTVKIAGNPTTLPDSGVTYSWSADPSLSITGANTSSATFTVPANSSSTSFKATLTMTWNATDSGVTYSNTVKG